MATMEYSNTPLAGFPKPNFLDLLATVASETLKNDKSLLHVRTRPLQRESTSSYTFNEVKKMNGSTLLRLFALPESDEMKKTYRFRCRLLPEKCSNVIASVGNEARAKSQMKAHLLAHVRERRRDTEERHFVPTGGSKGRKDGERDQRGAVGIYYTHHASIRDHSYSITSIKSGASNMITEEESDDTPNDVIGESISYAQFLGKDVGEDGLSSSIMDLEGLVSHRLIVNGSGTDGKIVPLVGSEVVIGAGRNFEEDGKSLSRREKEAATMAILLLQLKGSNTPVEDLSCSICLPPRLFSSYSSLLSHLKGHSGVKAFECGDCSAQFTRQHSLNYHRLIHDNQTRFTCKDCGRKFRHPSHYKEHRRRHTGELPFQCGDCLLRYKTRNTYKRHLRVNHGKILTSLGSVVRLNGEQEEEVEVVRSKPPSDGGGTDSSSSSSPSMTDEEEVVVPPAHHLSDVLKFNPNAPPHPQHHNKKSSPVPNFVSEPPLGAITPKKKINPTLVSNGVTISKYSSTTSSSSNNIENKANKRSFRPSIVSAFKTPPGGGELRVRNNVEIRKLICYPSEPQPLTNTSSTSKVKILQDSMETNNKSSAILAEIDGKRVLLIPKNEESSKPKSKLEECLLYGVQRAKSSV